MTVDKPKGFAFMGLIQIKAQLKAVTQLHSFSLFSSKFNEKQGLDLKDLQLTWRGMDN